MNFLIKKSKLIHILFGVICFTILISALIYMTQYANIRVFYTISDGQVYIGNVDFNNFIYNFASNNQEVFHGGQITSALSTVYTFSRDMSAFNDMIVVFAVLSLVLFAVMMITGNHNRKVYYVSNLATGIAAPFIVSIFSIIMIVQNCLLMGRFNAEYSLFNYISLLTDESTRVFVSQQVGEEALANVQTMFTCDTTSFVLYNVYFSLVLLVSLAMIGYSVFRFLESKEKRKEIIAKAVSSNNE